MRLHRLLAAAAMAGAISSAAVAQDVPQEGRAIIVLDGSGSMWGQIEERPKIVIARETLSSVLSEAPEDLSLGLMAYGHRERGACGDIELLVEPGPVAETVGPIVSAANAISPKGKTPISNAVRRAAEALRYTEERATVILVTDGIETCEADPCAVGAELEQLGIAFTAHVVGFGLSEEEGEAVACLAESTGGEYIQASNPGTLATALADTVAPLVARLTLVAVDQANTEISEPVQWSLLDRGTGDLVAGPTVSPSLEVEVDTGEYLALVSGDVAEGGLPFAVDRHASMTIDVPVERTAAAFSVPAVPQETTEAEDAAPTGTAFFEDEFRGSLDPAWTVANERADAWVVDADELFVVASGGRIYPKDETPPNLFLLDTPLPEGDFDIAVDLRIDAQTGKDQFWYGIYEDPNNYVAADLWMDPGGCGVFATLSIFKRDEGEETRDDVTLLDNEKVKIDFCTSERGLVDEEIADLAENGVTLELSRRGRRIFAAVEYTEPREGKPVRVETDAVTALGLSGRPFMLLGQYGRVQGETIAEVDRFAIEER